MPKLSVTLTAWRRTVGWLMSDGLEGMLKEPDMGYHFLRGAEENHERRLSIQRISRPKFVTCTSWTGEGMLITEKWCYTRTRARARAHTHTHAYIYIINYLILYALYRPLFLGIYKVINRYYWEMGISKSSYSGGSSVSTVTRLPEAHTLLFRCGMQTGSRANRAWYHHILARAFPWGNAVGVKFTNKKFVELHLHSPHVGLGV
jgi:hypothetical protein